MGLVTGLLSLNPNFPHFTQYIPNNYRKKNIFWRIFVGGGRNFAVAACRPAAALSCVLIKFARAGRAPGKLSGFKFPESTEKYV